MDGLTVLGLIMLIGGLFQSVIIPIDAKKKIMGEITTCDGQLIKFEELIYFKERIYDVEYEVKDKVVRKKARYRLFTGVEWL